MAKETSKPEPKSEAQSTPELEPDSDDNFEDPEFITHTDGVEKETIKRDVRRKIEIYWEKKRLRDEFEDFDDSEIGF